MARKWAGEEEVRVCHGIPTGFFRHYFNGCKRVRSRIEFSLAKSNFIAEKKQVLRQISPTPPTNFLCPTFLGHFSIDFTDWGGRRRLRAILMCSRRVCFMLSFENEEIATSSCGHFQEGSENSTSCYHTAFSVVHLGGKSGHARPCYSIRGIFAFVVAESAWLIVSFAALEISRAIIFQLFFLSTTKRKLF